MKKEFKVLRHMPFGDKGTKATLYIFDNFVGAQSQKKHLSLHYKCGQHRAHMSHFDLRKTLLVNRQK